MRVLVAPAAFERALRATVVAAAIGRGLESAGLEPPDLCPLSGGGPGTIEVLLGRLGGATPAAAAIGGGRAAGFALLDGGASALVEPAVGTGGDSRPTGELILAAAASGAAAVIVAAAGVTAGDCGTGALAAITAAGGLGGARLVVLAAGAGDRVFGALANGVPGAELRDGPAFVLDALEFDARMRSARALVVGEARLDAATLSGRVLGEAATRARQAGVPTHAIVGINAMDRFDARILDLQEILAASDLAGIEAAAAGLGARLARGLA